MYPSHRPRLIIPISLQFSVRYLLRTGLLRRIAEFCEPVMLLAWEDQELESELHEFGEVYPLPKAQWGANYERVRALLNAWHLKAFKSPSTPIRERRADLERTFRERLSRKTHLAARRALSSLPGAVPYLRKKEVDLLWRETNLKVIAQTLEVLRADGAFCLTPCLQDEELVVRACAVNGIPTCTAIMSFDNLTTRGWIPMTFDAYLLWNRYNRDELYRGYPESRNKVVRLVGSPQFDFYWDLRYIWTEDEWRRRLNLPPHRPVILFGGGYFTCAPHEPQFLKHIDEAIEKGEIPGHPLVLFRRHPVDPIARWEPILRNTKHVVHDDPWVLGPGKMLGHTNVRNSDVAKLASTLYHTVAHVNVASTMSIDGSILDRPQVGPAYDESVGHKYHRSAFECYQQEHFLPILNSGGLAVARSRIELIEAIRCALLNPAARGSGRARLVKEVLTFNDGNCTQRVSDAVAEFVLGITKTVADAPRVLAP